MENRTTSTTPVSDNKSHFDEISGVTDPKSQSEMAKGQWKNHKNINDQKDRDMKHFHMKLFENFITFQQDKWMEEESILKEKSENEFNLDKEKFEKQLYIDAEHKKEKVNNEREYNLERENFEGQIHIDAEEEDKPQCEFELEKEHMDCQLQLEKEHFERESMMSKRESWLIIACELILSGKSSE
ncbi:hypothetical protein O181_074601 [Austropuccinia psidii MF-1]|uniref:Uncharacterized protein n=1 Tax=Austropuccinia psidii MF-1 TaxID=1389203 RepID=A0A9Q3F6V8_9BASI|nr:hypothetical protein [Austropuccinia psidii MF-1]